MQKIHFIFSVFSFSYIFNKFWSKGNRIWCRMSFERTLIVIREIYYHIIKWIIIRKTLCVIVLQVWQIFNPWKVSWNWIAFYGIFLLLHIVWWETKLKALQTRSICQSYCFFKTITWWFKNYKLWGGRFQFQPPFPSSIKSHRNMLLLWNLVLINLALMPSRKHTICFL